MTLRREKVWIRAALLALGLWGVGCNRSSSEGAQAEPPIAAGEERTTRASTHAASVASSDKAASDNAASSDKAKPSDAQPDAAASPGAKKYHRPAAARIVAIGDLHGDFEATQKVLRMAGALGDDLHWAGQKLVVVQTGDQLDRGAGERQIMDLLHALAEEAKAAGGAVYALSGNHETMNVMGDFRYVTPEAVSVFDDIEPKSPLAAAISGSFRGRAGAFLPGGGMALRLAAQPLVLQVGDTVFVHGGLRAAHVSYGLDRLNREAADFMKGTTQRPPAPLVDSDGPLWTRLYGTPQVTKAACRELDGTLSRLGAKRLVVGHTIQNGGISAACGKKVYRIDIGMSSAYGGDTVQALEITEKGVRILKEGP